ncbi:hypothetical protein P9436_19575 [Lysinibacillus capsici]|uniref:hypothetical protein n=2 Tax=Lysinibacillus TaxID=400634 RepID=UPI002E224BD8|nr:hypothetical protein [Lysinibacillus capsici]
MSRNYKLLMQYKEIDEYFKKAPNIDIYDLDTMQSKLQLDWNELTYEDLEIMEDTILKEINKYNTIISFSGSILSVIMTLAVGFIGAFVGITVASDTTSEFKENSLFYIGIFVVLQLIIVGAVFYVGSKIHKKNNRLLTIITILKYLREQENRNINIG